MDARNCLSGTVKGMRAWSGNPPSSALSGDGVTVFWGVNVQDAANVLWYLVYSIGLDGVIRERFRYGPDAGQGQLEVDAGYLILSIFQHPGHGQQAERHVITDGWVRRT